MRDEAPAGGNAGASQFGDWCPGRHRQPYLWYQIINCYATAKMDTAANCLDPVALWAGEWRALSRVTDPVLSLRDPVAHSGGGSPKVPGGRYTVGRPLRQRARSRETPSGNRPTAGPPRSPALSSAALRSRTVAYARCSRTSEPIHLWNAA